MNDKTIRQTEAMLSKFMSGLTSLEEEQELAKIMRRNDIPEEWNDYKEMFCYFDNGMPLNNDGTEKLPTNGNTYAASAETYRKEMAKIKTLRPMLWAAAIIGILFSFTLLYNNSNDIPSADNAESRATTKTTAMKVDKEKENTYDLCARKVDNTKNTTETTKQEKAENEKQEKISPDKETEAEQATDLEELIRENDDLIPTSEIIIPQELAMLPYEKEFNELELAKREIMTAKALRLIIDMEKHNYSMVRNEEGELTIVNNNQNNRAI